MRRHSAHVDADVLAELSAGLISGKRATRIHAHLAGCQRCAQRSADLTEISTLLASVPPTMPDAVARRLNAALAQEVADRSATSTAPARSVDPDPDPDENVVQFRPAGKSRRRGLTSPAAARAFAAAAAACVVAAGGYTAVQLTSGSSANGPAAPTNAKAGGGSHAIGPTIGGGAHARPFILNTGTGTAGNGPEQPSFKVVDSGIDYRTATLATQVRTELNKVALLKSAKSGARALHTPTAQQYACVNYVTGGTTPALVDSARFQGHLATVIALAHVGNQLGQAWVVGPSCSSTDSDILKHVTLPTSGG